MIDRVKGAEPAVLDAVLLSIHSEHAERILDGSKRYELRKSLPVGSFRRVFLYETRGVGVVGCFDVESIIHLPIEDLWPTVGTGSTTEERFFEYFKRNLWGYAIEIANPVRFRRRLTLEALRQAAPGFVPPQSFLALVPGSQLLATLERARESAHGEPTPAVRLSRISPAYRNEYEDLVLQHISPNYDEVDKRFAASNLRLHDLGRDPVGFFTLRKEVLEIADRRDTVIGFTTLTYKVGGAVKTGPTILRPQFLHQGFGVATRRAIEEYLRQHGARKVYCTCPDTSNEVVRYLLQSGMRVEAHLELHYSTHHNELVFGKLLDADDAVIRVSLEGRDLTANLFDPIQLPRITLKEDVRSLVERMWFTASSEFADSLLYQCLDTKATEYEEKPKRILCLARDEHCVAAAILIPKRGGSTKGVLLPGLANRESLGRLVVRARELASASHRRKLYFLHPVLDSFTVEVLLLASFRVEGLLRAPYRAGQDVAILSTFL